MTQATGGLAPFSLHQKTIGPAQSTDFVGLMTNLRDHTLELPEDKRLKCVARLRKVILVYEKETPVTVKSLEKLAGLQLCVSGTSSWEGFSCKTVCAAIYPGSIQVENGDNRHV